jgi:hypothetical protein
MPTYNDLRPEKDFDKRDYELVFPGLQKQTSIKNASSKTCLA